METLVDLGHGYVPMDIAQDITGLTEAEIRSCSVVIDVLLVYDC